MSLKRLMLAKLSPYYTRIRYPGVFNDLSRFCLFIGHGRSGSTLVGALLNAHSEIVLSNELNVIDYLKKGLSYEELCNLIFYMSRVDARRGSRGGGGYTYAVPNQWQGRSENLRVIGDRKAGATAIQLYQEPTLTAKLQRTLQVPVYFICVARNPFDTLATTFRKTARLPQETPESHLGRQVEYFFERYSAVMNIIDELGEDRVKIVPHETLVSDPRGTLADLCSFLDVGADHQYLDDCASIVKPRANVTRTSIDWPPALVDQVLRKMEQIPWLTQYAFEE